MKFNYVEAWGRLLTIVLISGSVYLWLEGFRLNATIILIVGFMGLLIETSENEKSTDKRRKAK